MIFWARKYEKIAPFNVVPCPLGNKNLIGNKNL